MFNIKKTEYIKFIDIFLSNKNKNIKDIKALLFLKSLFVIVS